MHSHVHFESPLLRVEDFRCPAGHLRDAEEASGAHEIVLVRSGMFVRRDAAGSVTVDAGHGLFFQRHQAYDIQHPAGGGDRCTVFVLDDAALVDMLRGWNAAVVDTPERPFPAGDMPVTPRQQLAHFQLLQMADSADPLGFEEAALLLLGDVLRQTYAVYPAKQGRSVTGKVRRDIVQQVRQMLAARYAEPLRLDEVARAVNASAYWLCRIFRAETGVSLHQYLLRLRLIQALERLVECPHEGLTALALQLVFYSHSHFTTAFSREFGLAPSEFRQQASRARLTEMSKILEA